jgi:hypothetical protein
VAPKDHPIIAPCERRGEGIGQIGEGLTDKWANWGKVPVSSLLKATIKEV